MGDAFLLVILSTIWWALQNQLNGGELNVSAGRFERWAGSLIRWLVEGRSYWKAVIRFGLPFVIAYRVFSLPPLLASLKEDRLGFSKLLFHEVKIDIVNLVLLSTAWWILLQLLFRYTVRRRRSE